MKQVDAKNTYEIKNTTRISYDSNHTMTKLFMVPFFCFRNKPKTVPASRV